MAWFPRYSLQGLSYVLGAPHGRKGFLLKSHGPTPPGHTHSPHGSGQVPGSWPHPFLLTQSPPREPGLTKQQEGRLGGLRGRAGLDSHTVWVVALGSGTLGLH